MKKIWSILLAILLGAIVVGSGTGYFLYLANKDRRALAEAAEQAKTEAQIALQKSQTAISEANEKLSQANAEVEKAQNAIKELQNEQALLRDAKPLIKPQTKDLEGWIPVISTSNGISLFLPPGSKVNQDTADNFSIMEDKEALDNEEEDNIWFSVWSFDSKKFDLLKNKYASSSKISFFIDGKVVAGNANFNSENEIEEALLNIYSNGTTTHSLVIKNPPPFKFKSWQKEQFASVEEILQTMEFKK